MKRGVACAGYMRVFGMRLDWGGWERGRRRGERLSIGFYRGFWDGGRREAEGVMDMRVSEGSEGRIQEVWQSVERCEGEGEGNGTVEEDE